MGVYVVYVGEVGLEFILRHYDCGVYIEQPLPPERQFGWGGDEFETFEVGVLLDGGIVRLGLRGLYVHFLSIVSDAGHPRRLWKRLLSTQIFKRIGGAKYPELAAILFRRDERLELSLQPCIERDDGGLYLQLLRCSAQESTYARLVVQQSRSARNVQTLKRRIQAK